MASSIGRASALLASGTLVSRILGFVKAFLLIQAIGAVAFASNPYATSTIVPNSIYALIAQGILNAVLVPQIVRASSHADGGKGYINKLVTVGIIVFGLVALVATLLSPVLMPLFGLRGPAATSIATAFAYWSLPQIFFLGLYTLLGEVLNARKSFGPFTWAPVANNVVGITMLLIFIGAFGADPGSVRGQHQWNPAMIALLAGGATLGVALQAVLLFVFWRRVGLRFRLDFQWRGVNLGTAGRAAAWTFGMLVATQVAGLIETNVANSVGKGFAGPAIMNSAWLIFMLPQGIIAVSIVTAYYTRMAEHAHQGKVDSFRSDFSSGARSILLLIVLATAVLIVVAFPLASVFSRPFYVDYGFVLIAYLVGLVPFSIVFIAQRAFYSLSDTRTPFLFTLAQVVVIVVGVLLCFNVDRSVRAAAIALVVSLASAIQAIIAVTLLRRRIGGLDGRRIVGGLWRFLLAALAAMVAGAGFLVILGGVSRDAFPVSGFIPAILSIAIIGIIMAVVYVGALVLFRSRDLEDGLAPLLKRFGGRSVRTGEKE